MDRERCNAAFSSLQYKTGAKNINGFLVFFSKNRK